MTYALRLVGIAATAALLGLSSTSAHAQLTWDFVEPIDVASGDFGNKCPRLVLDASGNPVVFMGKANVGLYVVTSDNGAFNAPQLVPTDPGIFLSDAEGPDVATWGNTIGLAYQIAGEWATGAQFMRSDDGGQNWSASHPIAPNATEDHFMPIPAFDDNGNPFVALKLGSGNSAQEGVLRSEDGGTTWGPAEPASVAAGNGIACECCPSRTIYGNGRYHTIYRRNNNNLRDMWLVSSEDGLTWDQQLDLDPTDWIISACPETGASVSWLPDGRLASVFMSAGEGSSRIYANVSDPATGDAGSTHLLTPNPEGNSTQNQPDLAVGPNHTAVAWQENSSGWEIHLAIAASDNVPDGLIGSAFPITSEFDNLPGSNRHPDIAIHGNKLHVIWQNSGNGTVKYLRGTIIGTANTTAPQGHSPSPCAYLQRAGGHNIHLHGAEPNTLYRVFDLRGACLHEGKTDQEGHAELPLRILNDSSSPLFVSATTIFGFQTLPLWP